MASKQKHSGTFKFASDACPALQVFYNSFSRENVKLLDSQIMTWQPITLLKYSALSLKGNSWRWRRIQEERQMGGEERYHMKEKQISFFDFRKCHTSYFWLFCVQRAQWCLYHWKHFSFNNKIKTRRKPKIYTGVDVPHFPDSSPFFWTSF